jgi:hypothetical protein
MKEKVRLPPLAYIYFGYLAVLPVLALMGLFQTFYQTPHFKSDSISNGLLFMLLGALAYLTCIMFIHFPQKLSAQLFLVLDAPIQVAVFKWMGADLTWMQYFLLDFAIEASGFLLLLATIPAFYPKLLPNAMENKPFTQGGIAVACLFAGSLLSIYFLFGSTVLNLLSQQSIRNQIPIYTALLTTVWMYSRYLSTSPPADADARTVWVLVGYGLWIVMSFGLAGYLVHIGVSF